MRPCLKLRQRCLEKDYTAGQLAKKIGRSQSYVSQIMCAKAIPDASDLYGIATALEIAPADWGDNFFPAEVQRLLAQKIKERKRERV